MASTGAYLHYFEIRRQGDGTTLLICIFDCMKTNSYFLLIYFSVFTCKGFLVDLGLVFGELVKEEYKGGYGLLGIVNCYVQLKK